jgi:hypothetical protein
MRALVGGGVFLEAHQNSGSTCFLSGERPNSQRRISMVRQKPPFALSVTAKTIGE